MEGQHPTTSTHDEWQGTGCAPNSKHPHRMAGHRMRFTQVLKVASAPSPAPVHPTTGAFHTWYISIVVLPGCPSVAKVRRCPLYVKLPTLLTTCVRGHVAGDERVGCHAACFAFAGGTNPWPTVAHNRANGISRKWLGSPEQGEGVGVYVRTERIA